MGKPILDPKQEEAQHQAEERNREIKKLIKTEEELEKTYALLSHLHQNYPALAFWDDPKKNLKQMKSIIRDDTQSVPGQYLLHIDGIAKKETVESLIPPAAEQVYLDAVQYYAEFVSTTEDLIKKQNQTSAEVKRLEQLRTEAKTYAKGDLKEKSPYSNNSLAVLAHQITEKVKLDEETKAIEHNTQTTTTKLSQLLQKNILKEYQGSKRNWVQIFGAFKEARTKQIQLIQTLKDQLTQDVETDPIIKAKILYSFLELLNEQLLRESRGTRTKSRLESIIEKDMDTLKEHFPSLSDKTGEPERDQTLIQYSKKNNLTDIQELIEKPIMGPKRKR